MKKTVIFILIFCLFAPISDAQAVWNRTHLDKVKTILDKPMYAAAYNALLVDADSLLNVKPLSVTMKELPSPSGDRHDYVSLARYFHPDPTKSDGLPYINRDGITNPEINKWDRNRLGETARRITTLSLAWFFSDDDRYAKKAAELTRVWFLDSATKMNPHLEYAQMVPGINNGKGRPYGVLDAYSFVELLDGLTLLSGASDWTDSDEEGMKEWMAEFLDWAITSDLGREESRMANNHSTAYDVIVAAVAQYAGRSDIATQIISEFPEKRIFTQISPDGTQPHEMWRTLSYGYSQYNLTHMTDLFMIAEKLGLSIDHATGPEGQNFYKALDHLAYYVDKPADKWPGRQISGWDEKCQAVIKDLWRTAAFVDTTRTDYRSIYKTNRVFNPRDIFTLLYYSPDEFDNAFTGFSTSLKTTADRTLTERQKENNRLGHKLNPRSIDKNGVITLVHPHDWTSGFFPGELWMMYEFTNDTTWRNRAAEFSWDIEEAKDHAGTHDLGFMIGNSFGKAWELTGDTVYFNIVKRASDTLAERFNPVVGAIRSWDHNPDQWKYPVIIDNMMNLEMLFKMSEATGDPKYHDIAISHANKTLRNHFRPDKSSYHVVDYDPDDGSVRMKVTAQGYSDDSFWSRGQGWAIYGYTMCYRYTKDQRYLDHACRIADWFLSQENLPSDYIPYWDMKAPGAEIKDNKNIVRDASAAAIIASGLYELAEYTDPDKGRYYRETADKIIDSLMDHYTLNPSENEGFILGHSTGHLPAGSEIDVPIVYADYYLLEALLRKRNYLNRQQ